MISDKGDICDEGLQKTLLEKYLKKSTSQCKEGSNTRTRV